MFNLSSIYSARKSSNHKLSIVMTQIYIKQNIHKHRTQNFRRTSPLGITPAEKAQKARTRWHRGPLRRPINTRPQKSIKKEWTETINNSKILYKCITENTSVTWQHAAHTTDHLPSLFMKVSLCPGIILCG